MEQPGMTDDYDLEQEQLEDTVYDDEEWDGGPDFNDWPISPDLSDVLTGEEVRNHENI